MIKKKITHLLLSLFSLSCLTSCLTSNHIEQTEYSEEDDSSISVTSEIKNDFTGISFENASFTYDGQPHSVYVDGAPDFAVVTYEGNDKVNASIYTVNAHIEAENYNSLDLSATLTINKAEFTNITFEGKTFDYDGEPHSLIVEGAPSEATITYTNNDKTSVGTYSVTAKISSPNYNTLTKTAVLRILGKNIEGVTFNDQTFIYDGNKHSVEVSGELPEGVSVNYSNNNQTNAGTYIVTARLSGEGYEPLELTANLIIKPAEIEKPGYFSDACYLYDGNYHSITVSNPPSGATVTYKCLNASGTNSFKNPGQYNIEATIKINANHISVLTATLFIIEEGSICVDNTKTPLKIDENLKWDDLYSALSKDNYSYDYFYGYYDVENIDDPRPSDLLMESCSTHDTRMHFATDGKEAYSKYYSTYDDPYYGYSYYKEVENDICYLHFSDNSKNVEIEKFPKAAFSETVCKAEAANAFVALSKGENGEFTSGIDGDDYYKDVGYPFIQDDKFIVLMEHPRTLDNGYRYFYEIYEFYNIGNSTVNLPSSSAPSSDYMENDTPIGDYRLGGVKYCYASYGSYNNMVSYYPAEIYVSYKTKVFLKPGTYTVLPYIYDEPVRAIVHYSYYSRYYNYDQSGYTMNLYIDEDGNYQGEYADLGSIKRLSIRDFTSDDGIINYYDDWHE